MWCVTSTSVVLQPSINLSLKVADRLILYPLLSAMCNWHDNYSIGDQHNESNKIS